MNTKQELSTDKQDKETMSLLDDEDSSVDWLIMLIILGFVGVIAVINFIF